MWTLRRAGTFAAGLAVVCMGLSDTTNAVDGAIIITQGLALVGSITPGDAPGFPISITQPGLYRLAGNLTLPDANTAGFQLQSDDVTIDLNGFTLAGPTTCTGGGGTLSCSPTGSGAGIGVPGGATRNRIFIRNGRIKGAGGAGIDLASGLVPGRQQIVEDVVVTNSGVGGPISGGIRLGAQSTIRRCIVEANAGFGALLFGTGGIMEDSIVAGNLREGVFVGEGTLLRTIVRSNGSRGVVGGAGSNVQENTVLSNALTGIDAADGSFVARNTLRSNSTGIALGLNAVASRNVLTLTGGIGLAAGGISALDNFCDGVGC